MKTLTSTMWICKVGPDHCKILQFVDSLLAILLSLLIVITFNYSIVFILLTQRRGLNVFYFCGLGK